MCIRDSSKSTMFRQRKQQLFKSFRLSPKVLTLRPGTAASFFPSAAPGNGSKNLGASRLSGSGQSSHVPVSYTHLRAHETSLHLVCRLLLEKKKKKKKENKNKHKK
eukprot:TRINITY_DN17220_c0_g1_i1.p2 TRINITY_DN17220_c0_g1~~TRINITY_DN17220_c0_g1_i1.p2  ORF type:complete len:106 (-),score=31.29 TRINITY_DN17220_c0_g1_i1:23-340(-)